MNAIRAFVLFAYMGFSLHSFALPEGAQVTVGSATLSPSTDPINGQQLLIQQHTDRVAIEYQSFNIDAGETVRFIQPGRDSIALNRVLGPNASEIMGNLKANGQVFLINPNGVLFAPGAQIDVAGLIATTLDIQDQDFMNGHHEFNNALHTTAEVVNQGQLSALSEGYIVLLANTVSNEGTINALKGDIALVSADNVVVQVADKELAIETDAASWQGLVENQGTIKADGGVVLMQADVANSLYNTVIANTGDIQAKRFEDRNGEIWLVGGEEGDVWQQGTIDVSATQNHQGSGGNIHIQGQRVAHGGTSLANGASSADDVIANGGSLFLTADNSVALTETSRLAANAGNVGQGGTVIALSPNQTIFRQGAEIAAHGGVAQGDGGFVDVSGWQQVEANGAVDVSAANGSTGTYLIDPFDITIDAADTGGSFDGGSPTNTWTPSATGSTVNSNTITTNLTTANVIIQTAGGGAENGDIVVNSTIDLDGSNGNQLSLIADGTITLNADIADQDTATVDDTNLVFTASGDFNITAGNQVNATGGTIAITSSANVNVSGISTTNSSATAVSIISNATLSGNSAGVDINAANGGVDINSIAGVSNLDIQAASLSLAGSGDIAITETDDIDLTVTGGFDNFNVSAGGGIGLADAGISTTTSLSLAGTSLSDSDATVILDSPTITLNSDLATGDTVVDTTATTANITTTSTNAITLNKIDAGNLAMGTFSVAGDFIASLTNGNLTLPATVNLPGLLSVSANDVAVSNVTSQSLLLDITGGSGDLNLNTTVANADISTVSRNILISESDGLVLSDLNSDGSALSVSDGNVSITVAAGDLTINNDITATDTAADGTRAGLIDLSVNGGNVSIGTSSAVQIVSTNTVDQGANGGLGAIPGNQTAIRIRQLDATDQTNSFVFGDGVGSDVTIQAEGGDIYLDSVGGATLSEDNSRVLQVNSDVTISSFNNGADALDGTVSTQGIDSSGSLLARTGRSMTLVGAALIDAPVDNGDVQTPGLDDTLNDILEEPDAEVIPPVISESPAGKTPLDKLFADVFGDCREQRRGRNNCQVDNAVKRFMGSLLIGGDLPD
ncbi:MAG: filamentous hemagglutinin N-terminal domain-containing protein [Pseudomonadales bacterium]|nr:filamentous hemagglutinin N-terminal domain-containing protein [Pseudomonadales bacterium]